MIIILFGKVANTKQMTPQSALKLIIGKLWKVVNLHY